jgi:predicted transcriptional regulator
LPAVGARAPTGPTQIVHHEDAKRQHRSPMKQENKTAEVKRAIEQVMASSGGVPSDGMVEKLMEALYKTRLLRYHNDDINLLSTAGRVLVVVTQDPTVTLRAISVYLNLSETMVDRTIKNLVESGLITKTKTNRQNTYKVNFDVVKKHLDIQQFMEMIRLANEKSSQVGDEPPF